MGLPFVYRVYRFFDGLNIFLGFGLVRMGSEGAFLNCDFLFLIFDLVKRGSGHIRLLSFLFFCFRLARWGATRWDITSLYYIYGGEK